MRYLGRFIQQSDSNFKIRCISIKWTAAHATARRTLFMSRGAPALTRRHCNRMSFESIDKLNVNRYTGFPNAKVVTLAKRSVADGGVSPQEPKTAAVRDPTRGNSAVKRDRHPKYLCRYSLCIDIMESNVHRYLNKSRVSSDRWTRRDKHRPQKIGQVYFSGISDLMKWSVSEMSSASQE